MEFAKSVIRDVKDFPKPGIIFKDITPLLESPRAFEETLNAFENKIRDLGTPIDKIVAIESRGFIFGAPLADRLKAGLVLARKPGKLPSKTVSASFKLEYGEDRLEIHEDSIKPGEKVIIIDDVLATGGTMEAVEKLVGTLKGDVRQILFLMDIPALEGGKKLKAPYTVIC